jgi:hypothetical protein
MPICTDCGREHPRDSLELTFRRPDVISELEMEEREARIQENSELCVLDGTRFFIRALLPLRVLGRVQPYNIGLWVEVSQRDFERVYELWGDEEQASEPAFQGKVANDIPIHPSICGLAAFLSLTGPKTRPVLRLAPAEHPLFEEQVRGITEHRAYEYSNLLA